jgi:ubiquinone/menaquinone biosynthesis C-methylase UbiE
MSAAPGRRARERERVADYRRQSLEHWEASASGWVARQEALRRLSEPVSQWMVEAIEPQPGQRVLELAAGLGETGFRVAELVAPIGGVITSDQSEAMLDGARARASELGLSNVEFQALNAEWIDLPLASVDAVLCRWGYMLMADPAAALRETRRVLRPGGRVALAVWDALEHNPWAALPARELIERGLSEPPPPGQPGPFALGDRERLRELLEQAGFTAIWVQALDLCQRAASFQELWETMLDLSRNLHDAVLARPRPEIEQIRTSLAKRFVPYTAPDGSLAVPLRTLVAAATA